MYDYAVIFIGSGHACWHGAVLLALAKKKVALVERDLLGGTSTNYGCDAKILLDSPIELKEALDRYEGIGLRQAAEANPDECCVEKVAFGETMAWLNKAERDARIVALPDRLVRPVCGAYREGQAAYVRSPLPGRLHLLWPRCRVGEKIETSSNQALFVK